MTKIKEPQFRAKDIALVETPQGDICVHRADCPAVRAAADQGWMVVTMFKVQKRSALRGLQRHECLLAMQAGEA